MKKLMLLCALVMAGFALQAQDQDQDRDRDQDRDQLRQHLLYEDGTLYAINDPDRDQDRDQVRDRIHLNDGTVVNPDGSYQTSTGKQLRLRDGQCLDMEGNVYRNQSQFRTQSRSRLEASAKEHLMYQNGQLYRVQNNQQEQVEQQVRLQNGWVVNPDGTYYGKNGKLNQLQAGEILDMEGKRYQSQERFREITAARLRERSEGQLGEGQKTRTRTREKSQQQMKEKQEKVNKEGAQRRKGS